jgi:hypothetical protein
MSENARGSVACAGYRASVTSPLSAVANSDLGIQRVPPYLTSFICRRRQLFECWIDNIPTSFSDFWTAGSCVMEDSGG